MSNQRYTPEFKEEAVRQVLEKGHSVPEVAERLGVSGHSLYKWVNAQRPPQAPLGNSDGGCTLWSGEANYEVLFA